ncbi:hypothetical protein ACJMK2_024143 [Sinanodonta woodiana]|uniref:Uncharacterized protein n=1 Tax=Sinanodonta woodiana TaxID=1069815 RepID=A0ABD3T6G6_SINWO
MPRLITVANGYLETLVFLTVDHQNKELWEKKKKHKKETRRVFDDSWKKHVPEEDLSLINEIETIIAPRKIKPENDFDEKELNEKLRRDRIAN